MTGFMTLFLEGADVPRPEIHYRRQDAVLWSRAGIDDAGEATVSAPVEIRVRWVDRQMEALDVRGETIALDALVVTDQAIIIGSILRQGTIEDYEDLADDAEGTELYQVVTERTTPDVKGRISRRTYGLIRWRDSLPEVV